MRFGSTGPHRIGEGCKGETGGWGLGLQVHTGQGRVVKVEQVGEVWFCMSTQDWGGLQRWSR